MTQQLVLVEVKNARVNIQENIRENILKNIEQRKQEKVEKKQKQKLDTQSIIEVQEKRYAEVQMWVAIQMTQILIFTTHKCLNYSLTNHKLQTINYKLIIITFTDKFSIFKMYNYEINLHFDYLLSNI
jgi:hypothetical protein